MPAEASKSPPQPPRILIVDDDPGQRSLFNYLLRSQFFETVLADSGAGAEAAIPPENFLTPLACSF